jgi:hypothetical protein
MLEYLAYYALFAVLMTGCLLYVMSALETKEIPPPKQQGSKPLFNCTTQLLPLPAAMNADRTETTTTLTLNGNNPAEWQLNTPWNDNLGALFSHDG